MTKSLGIVLVAICCGPCKPRFQFSPPNPLPKQQLTKSPTYIEHTPLQEPDRPIAESPQPVSEVKPADQPSAETPQPVSEVKPADQPSAETPQPVSEVKPADQPSEVHAIEGIEAALQKISLAPRMDENVAAALSSICIHWTLRGISRSLVSQAAALTVQAFAIVQDLIEDLAAVSCPLQLKVKQVAGAYQSLQETLAAIQAIAIQPTQEADRTTLQQHIRRLEVIQRTVQAQVMEYKQEVVRHIIRERIRHLSPKEQKEVKKWIHQNGLTWKGIGSPLQNQLPPSTTAGPIKQGEKIAAAVQDELEKIRQDLEKLKQRLPDATSYMQTCFDLDDL